MSLSTEELLTRFAAEHYEPNSISERRRHQSNVVLRALAERLEGRSLIELTPADLMSWQGAELKRGLAPSTVLKEQTMVRTFIGWAYTVGLISFELSVQLKSVNGVRGGDVRPRPNPYKRREIEHFRELLAERYPLAPTSGRHSTMLRRYLQGRSRFHGSLTCHARRLQFEAMVSLALEEGLRRIEIHRITMAEVHYDNAAVVVRTAKGKPGQRREREVPWTDHSRQCVQDWLDFRALMVPGHDGPWLTLAPRPLLLSPMSEGAIAHALDVFGAGWRWHRFRHTFATERLRAGMPLEQLQVMMGHAKLDQTLAYAEIVNADVRTEAARTERAFERAVGVA